MVNLLQSHILELHDIILILSKFAIKLLNWEMLFNCNKNKYTIPWCNTYTTINIISNENVVKWNNGLIVLFDKKYVR